MSVCVPHTNTHLGGVAADLNEASEGVLQVLSDDYVQSKGPVPVGGVARTQGEVF